MNCPRCGHPVYPDHFGRPYPCPQCGFLATLPGIVGLGIGSLFELATDLLAGIIILLIKIAVAIGEAFGQLIAGIIIYGWKLLNAIGEAIGSLVGAIIIALVKSIAFICRTTYGGVRVASPYVGRKTVAGAKWAKPYIITFSTTTRDTGYDLLRYTWKYGSATWQWILSLKHDIALDDQSSPNPLALTGKLLALCGLLFFFIVIGIAIYGWMHPG